MATYLLDNAGDVAALERQVDAIWPELERPGFSRMMELLRIGELDLAVRELTRFGISDGQHAHVDVLRARIAFARCRSKCAGSFGCGATFTIRLPG